MRVLRVIMVALVLGILTASAVAASGRIVKVLPLCVDRAGRVALSPSLFERDTYQAQLRSRPSDCAGWCFDIQWKARQVSGQELTLRTELLTTRSTKDHPLVMESPVRARTGWSRWTRQSLTGEPFRQAGDLIAWRVTLWAGDKLLGEQKSFLW